MRRSYIKALIARAELLSLLLTLLISPLFAAAAPDIAALDAPAASTPPVDPHFFWYGGAIALSLFALFVLLIYLDPRPMDYRRGVITSWVLAITAGFAGGFMVGGALFQYHVVSGNSSYFVSGTAGFALFFITLIATRGLRKQPTAERPQAPTAISIPDGWSFSQVISQFPQTIGVEVSLEGFSKKALAAPMTPGNLILEQDNAKRSMVAVRAKVKDRNVIPAFDVIEDGPYKFVARARKES